MTSSSTINCNLFFLSGSHEEAWFLYCLSELRPIVARGYKEPWKSLLAVNEQNSFDIYYTNPTNQEGRDSLEAIRSARNPEYGHGLLIGGDENFLVDPSIYSGAKFVIRTYLTGFYKHPRLLTIPEGPCFRSDQYSLKPIAPLDRQMKIFFSGQIKYSRISMARIFRSVPGSKIVDSSQGMVTQKEYLSSLMNSRFSLCPNGNTTPDTLRLYEALEVGVVPIAERTWSYDYLGSLFKECPIPRFCSWSSARHFVVNLGETQYLCLQEKVNQWWAATKQTIPINVDVFVRRSLSSHDEHFKPMSRVAFVVYRIRATLYLIGINSLSALFVRVVRLSRDYLPGFWS